jgi:hypothetical protein
MSIKDIEAILPTKEELEEQGIEVEDDEREAQDEADGLEDANISA